MAVRHAIRRYPDFLAYLQDWQSSLKLGMLILPKGAIAGEPALEMTVDVVLPGGKRVDRVPGQVVNRFSDGTIALRIAAVPGEFAQAATEAEAVVDRVRAWLEASGQLGKADVAEVAGLQQIGRAHV